MTTEQKAKAYEEAIERAKKQLDGAKVFDYKEKQIAHDVRTTTYAIFPELKESEDEEKIKKALISAINNICNGDEGLVTFNGFSKEQVLAWLEKQSGKKPCMIQWKGDNLKEVLDFTGKDKNFDKWFKSFEDYERYVHEHNNTFKLFNEDGSHYEVPVGAWIVKTPDGYNVASKAFFVQKPTEWSEEDRLLINEIIELIDAGSLNREEKDDYIERLKSLKERVHPQPKQEWSEDDEYNFAFIQEALLGLDGDDSYREKCCKMADWLESLKDKFVDFDKGFNVGFSAAKYNQWKPTKDQIDALFAAVYLKALRNTLEKDSVKQLEELYNQLKKLKEE